jgi:signal transduction histidine kinase
MSISVFFSIIIYKGTENEIDRLSSIQRQRIERRLQNNNLFPQPPNIRTADPELVEETKQRLLIILIMINGGIVFFAGSLSYLLAGKTLHPIQEMVEEQNRFISNASHELRTPLTALKSSLEVNLRDKNLSLEEARKIISESIEDVNKLQFLSDSLLQLTQYKKTEAQTKFELLSLQQIIKESVKKINPLIQKKNIIVKNKTQNIDVKGNKYSLIDLFVIILDNAVKYSQDKSTITIYTKKTEKSVIISVKDQGIGIDEEDLKYVFDRFYRSDKARSKGNIDGYGLGLSIAKEIVNSHKGSINIESKIKKGTTVNISLPVFS